ncbi:hypothetical protein BSZ35_15900 [Salinibacter sp. 10B]|uniref:YbjN domain-containing protein n=1 Tax=Salinibacter sp. 10B TaxID=1923971 RepID=UPI000CF57D34|nr:YbjN domain-containing protein [Salinibacter sp. 10B]PQJ35884.1 hypothetical protein BSZ35_15900 [Salinibacter sp. 10B]
METTQAERDAEVFQTICNWVGDIGLVISRKNTDEYLLVVEDEERGISNMVIDCEDPIVEIQQSIMAVPGEADTAHLFERLLQMNGTLVHGAFMLSDDGTQIRFRDTLRLGTLDLEELRGTINALHFALEEYGDELIDLRRSLD